MKSSSFSRSWFPLAVSCLCLAAAPPLQTAVHPGTGPVIAPGARSQMLSPDLGRDRAASASAGELGGLFLCPMPTNYCTATANSTGAPAQMSFAGSLSIADDNLTFFATSMPIGQPGALFYGFGRVSLPLGDGTLCVDPQGLGFFVRMQVSTVSIFGGLSFPVDFDDQPVPEAMFLPGVVYHFQAWYLDPDAGGAGFNLSDGLELGFCL